MKSQVEGSCGKPWSNKTGRSLFGPRIKVGKVNPLDCNRVIEGEFPNVMPSMLPPNSVSTNPRLERPRHCVLLANLILLSVTGLSDSLPTKSHLPGNIPRLFLFGRPGADSV